MPIKPSRELIANVICVFMRKAIKIPVIMGIINTHGVILNVDCNAVIISSECVALFVSDVSPTMVYINNAIIIAGDEVSIKYLIWVNNSTLQDDDAKTVVSERGETLSPKYAPEIIAPAIQPSLYPIICPMP